MDNFYHRLIILALCLVVGCTWTKPHVANESISLSKVAIELEMQIYWDPVHNCARLERPDQFIAVRPDSDTIQIGSQRKSMPDVAYKHEGEIYIPLSFYHKELQNLTPPAPVEDGKEQAETPAPKAIIKENTDFLVVIDAGHGGKDTGAIGIEDVLEKDLNLDVANLVAGKLREEGLAVLLTREDDTFITLDRRVEIANTNRADCFVSIHFNSVGFPTASGYEIWKYGSDSDLRQIHSTLLARKIHSYFKSGLPLKDRGIRDYRDLRVIKNTTMPAVLVECGFVSNPEDMRWFASYNNKDKAAGLISRAIVSFLRSIAD